MRLNFHKISTNEQRLPVYWLFDQMYKIRRMCTHIACAPAPSTILMINIASDQLLSNMEEKMVVHQVLALIA